MLDRDRHPKPRPIPWGDDRDIHPDVVLHLGARAHAGQTVRNTDKLDDQGWVDMKAEIVKGC